MSVTPPVPPFGPPEPPSPKRGLSPLAWTGIGCGAFLFIAIVALAFLFGWGKRKFDEFKRELAVDPQRKAAELVLSMNPDFELVEGEAVEGEMRIRNVRTGEETTVRYGDVAAGRLSVEGPDGAIELGAQGVPPPEWVPAYPNVARMLASYRKEKDGKLEGVVAFTTDDAPERVTGFFDAEFAGSVRVASTTNLGGVEKQSLVLQENGRHLEIAATRANASAPTQVTVIYRADVSP